ncbi:MAG: hypothetical protein OYL92_17030 [Acidobacteriota bacterium]|nr:hypothetical protein [Acidobacteriota bacterium]MDE3266671.1 hypothetical protein [Acidobacteriota bacterium]
MKRNQCGNGSAGIGGCLGELMLLYSRRGLDEWNGAKSDLRRKALECLSAAGIVETEDEAEEMIEGSSCRRMFIPMPEGGRGFERSFFLPSIVGDRLKALTLFLLVNRARRDSIAFRFECAERSGTRHGYTHVQLTRDLRIAGRPDRLQGVPEWLPESYPAFPVPARDSLELFLAMATAVHGFPDGIDSLIVDLHRGGRMDRARGYQERLRTMLAVLA